MRRFDLMVVLGLVGLAGCATAQMRGETAFRQGRYDEAIGHFEAALAKNPEQLDPLIGLGIARYKLGAFDEAIDVLNSATTHDPRNARAQLYLGLSYLEKGEDGAAEEHLSALRDLRPHPRLAAQVDRALRLMRGDPLSDELRRFIAASLDDEAELVREVNEAQRQAAFRTGGPSRVIFFSRGRHR